MTSLGKMFSVLIFLSALLNSDPFLSIQTQLYRYGEKTNKLDYYHNFQAETNAARVFGAEHTFFVLSGTTCSNKMIFQSEVTRGDIVLLDRNSHKSSMQAIQMSGALPIYLMVSNANNTHSHTFSQPTRNEYGIIGPVSFNQFTVESIQQKINQTGFIPEEKAFFKLNLLQSILENVFHHAFGSDQLNL